MLWVPRTLEFPTQATLSPLQGLRGFLCGHIPKTKRQPGVWMDLGCAGWGVHTHMLRDPEWGKKRVTVGLGPPSVFARLAVLPLSVRGELALDTRLCTRTRPGVSICHGWNPTLTLPLARFPCGPPPPPSFPPHPGWLRSPWPPAWLWSL